MGASPRLRLYKDNATGSVLFQFCFILLGSVLIHRNPIRRILKKYIVWVNAVVLWKKSNSAILSLRNIPACRKISNLIQHTRNVATAQNYNSRIGLCSVLRPRQHSIGYMGDGFYRSKDPTNSIKVLKEKAVKENNQKNKENTKFTCTETQNSRQTQHTSTTQQVP